MTILALDLGKFKTVACIYISGCDERRFVTLPTDPQAFHDLFVAEQPERVVIEACSIMGWVADLAEGLELPIQVVNTNDERWSWKKVKRKTDRDAVAKQATESDGLNLRRVPLPETGAVVGDGSGRLGSRTQARCSAVAFFDRASSQAQRRTHGGKERDPCAA